MRRRDTGHCAFARRAIYLRDSLSFKQELNMRNQIHELSIDDLDEVSGGNGQSLDIHNCWSYPRTPEGPVDPGGSRGFDPFPVPGPVDSSGSRGFPF
jgi:hypothetical protein